MVLVLSVTIIRIYVGKIGSARFRSTLIYPCNHRQPKTKALTLIICAGGLDFACPCYHHSKNNAQPPPSSQALTLHHKCTLQSRRIRRQKRSENDSIKGLVIEHNAYLFCFMQCAERAGFRRDSSPQTPCQT